MLNILINLKVIFSAIFIKIKKFYYKNYDPYLPLPKKLILVRVPITSFRFPPKSRNVFKIKSHPYYHSRI